MHEQVVTTSKAVLVVEDSTAQCELLNQALAEHGFDSDIHIEQGVSGGAQLLAPSDRASYRFASTHPGGSQADEWKWSRHRPLYSPSRPSASDSRDHPHEL